METALTFMCFEGVIHPNGSELFPMGAVVRALPVAMTLMPFPWQWLQGHSEVVTVARGLPVAAASMVLPVKTWPKFPPP